MSNQGLMVDRERCNLNQFSTHFEKTAITEWMVAYIDFQYLNECLLFIHNCFQCYHKRIFKNHRKCIEVIPLDPSVEVQLRAALELMDLLIRDGELKAKMFVQWKLTEILYYWEQVIDVTVSHELLTDPTHDTY